MDLLFSVIDHLVVVVLMLLLALLARKAFRQAPDGQESVRVAVTTTDESATGDNPNSTLQGLVAAEDEVAKVNDDVKDSHVGDMNENKLAV